jgi:hypothetical protein
MRALQPVRGTQDLLPDTARRHRRDADIVDHLVELVEKKAAEIEAQRRAAEPVLEPAQ